MRKGKTKSVPVKAFRDSKGRITGPIPYSEEDTKRVFFQTIVKDKKTNCWVWTGAASKGYGWIRYKQKSIMAHRYSYLIHKGQFDKTKCVLHKCDNPPCCNPDHLFLGTRADNRKDCIAKGRAVYLKGVNHGSHKLNPRQVSEIRASYGWRGIGGMSAPALAKKYGITTSGIWHVLLGKVWKEIQPKPFQPGFLP